MSRKLITRLNPRSTFPDNSATGNRKNPAARKRARETHGTEAGKRTIRETITPLDIAGGCSALSELGYLLLLVRQAGQTDLLGRLLERSSVDWPDFVRDDSPRHNSTDGPIILAGAIYRAVNREPCSACRGFGSRVIRKRRTSTGWRHLRGVCSRCEGKGTIEVSDARVAMRLGIPRTTYGRKYGESIAFALHMLDRLEVRAAQVLEDQVTRDGATRRDLTEILKATGVDVDKKRL